MSRDLNLPMVKQEEAQVLGVRVTLTRNSLLAAASLITGTASSPPATMAPSATPAPTAAAPAVTLTPQPVNTPEPTPVPYPAVPGIVDPSNTGWPREVETVEGRITLAAPPERILTYSLGHDELLLSLVPADRIAAIGKFTGNEDYSNVSGRVEALAEVPAVVNGDIHVMGSKQFTTLSHWNVRGIEVAAQLLYPELFEGITFEDFAPYSGDWSYGDGPHRHGPVRGAATGPPIGRRTSARHLGPGAVAAGRGHPAG